MRNQVFRKKPGFSPRFFERIPKEIACFDLLSPTDNTTAIRPNITRPYGSLTSVAA